MYKNTIIILFLLLMGLPLKAESPQHTAEDIPDSLLTEKHITHLHLTAPDSALLLLDEAERRHTPGMELFRIDLLRSMTYGSKSMYTLCEHYIRRALASDSVQLVPKRKLRALSQLTITLEQRNMYEEGIRTANETLILARQLGQSIVESQLLSTIGRMYIGMHRPNEGINYMKQAINRLQHTENLRELVRISEAYGDLMTTLTDNNRLQEAIEAGLQRAGIIHRMSQLSGPPPGYIDRQYAYLYSKMAYIYQLAHQPAKAEEAYRNYLSTNYAHSAWGQSESLPYLINEGRYREAIQINQNIQKFFQGQDTINYAYLIMLNRFAQSYRGLQRHTLSDAYQQRITVLTDSIYSREKESRAQEFAAIFDTQEKKVLIAQQGYQLNSYRILTYSVSLILMLSLSFLLINYRHLRKIREKNHVAARQIDELLAQRKQLRQLWQEELEKKKTDEADETDEAEENEPTAAELRNRHIFQKMENSLLSEKAYLNPDYGRDNLLELTNLNRNRLTEIIKEHTGFTPNTYLNHLRIEHAVYLMKTYPHYSIESIAFDSGFNS
ncbi:AraC family transcriptional regulator [Bacteroides timonensis]|uniref:AraC family transcriptional regulator n=1 Tax=Bacteroides timonensis TaxID=1470345 RepID=UPI0004BCCA04|nr:helix-turn-helix domain-containing protein [Bacteroides timonensis]